MVCGVIMGKSLFNEKELTLSAGVEFIELMLHHEFISEDEKELFLSEIESIRADEFKTNDFAIEYVYTLLPLCSLPEKNCSCHLAPPCSDCYEYGLTRELYNSINSGMKNLKIKKARDSINKMLIPNEVCV